MIVAVIGDSSRLGAAKLGVAEVTAFGYDACD
jgi:hypothetical protein